MRRNDGSGDPLFTERDPKGRSVVLEKERYIEHIQTRHPEISIEAIRSCVSSPDYIIADRRYYSRENYFARSKGMTTMGLVGQLIKRELEQAEASSADFPREGGR